MPCAGGLDALVCYPSLVGDWSPWAYGLYYQLGNPRFIDVMGEPCRNSADSNFACAVGGNEAHQAIAIAVAALVFWIFANWLIAHDF